VTSTITLASAAYAGALTIAPAGKAAVHSIYASSVVADAADANLTREGTMKAHSEAATWQAI
jgi:hypothetical protein